jgi:hypothetical protein
MSDHRRNVGAEPRRILPPRIVERPSPVDWKDDELLSLVEAAALFWPHGGPLTATSLRTAVRDGKLEVVEIAGKLLTTKIAIARMSVCGLRTKPAGSGTAEP